MREGWEYKKLGEVCTIERGGSPRPITNYITDSEDGINWIKIGDAQEGSKYITSTKEKIKSEGIKKSRFVHKGDFILSNSMSFGRPYILKVDGCIHDGWLVIHDNNEVFIKDYLYYILSSPIMYAKFSQLAVGGVVNNLNSSLVRKVAIPLPPKSTQLAIVSELDKINELIRLKKEQLKDLDKLAQSLFYEMFGDPVENEKGWEVKKLGEVCNVGTGSTPNRKNKDFYENGIYPWVKSTEVCNLPIYSVEEYITQEALDKTNCTLYPQNTILMAMYGQGKTRGQIGLLKIEACTNQAVAAIVPTKEVVDENYICLHLMLMYEHIRNMARGGNQANLNLSIVKSIQIILPPLPLQHLFAQRIEQIEHQKSEVQKAITNLETLLASRMQYWFE